MNIFRNIIFLLFLGFLTSCATFKKNEFANEQRKLTKENLHLLNGTYKNSSLTKTDSLRDNLFFSGTGRIPYNFEETEFYSIKLEVINDKRVQVNILKNNEALTSYKIKGKLKNGYFEGRRKYFFVPTIYLNVFRTRKFRIGILENDNLITDFKEIAFGTGFVIIPFYDKTLESNFEYKKLDL